MAIETRAIGDRRGNPWRIAGWGIAAALLLIPFVAMQFTSEVAWSPADFVFAGVMLGTVGLLFELAVRKSSSWAYRGGVAAALAAAFLIVWATGAVGMIGSENEAYNLLFPGVILVALGGAILVRFRSAGMARVMTVAAVLHGGVAVGGLASDPPGALFSMVFALPWLVSAALFHKAAKQG